MARHLITIACALGVAFATPALACVSEERSLSIDMAANPGQVLDHRLSGDDARAFMAAFNAIPPPSDYRADTVLIFSHPRYPRVRRAILMLEGCQVNAWFLDAWVVIRALGGET